MNLCFLVINIIELKRTLRQWSKMAPDAIVDAHITYVKKEGPLIKIFAQVGTDNGRAMETVLSDLKEVFEYNHNLKPQIKDISVGLICCAKLISIDGDYYRARIVSLGQTWDLKVTVLLIDYGKTAEIEVTNLRLISKIGQCIGPHDEKIKVLAMANLANEYVFCMSITGQECDDNTIQIINEQLSNTDMKCCINDQVNGSKLIAAVIESECDINNMLKDLFNTGYLVPFVLFPSLDNNLSEGSTGCLVPFIFQCPDSKLSEEKCMNGTPSRFNTPPPAANIMKEPPPGFPPMLHPPNPNCMPSGVGEAQVTPGNIALSPTMPSTPTQQSKMPVAAALVQAPQFAIELLPKGLLVPVFVTYVENGPYAFGVQLCKDVVDLLGPMMMELKTIIPEEIVAPLYPGNMCLGRIAQKTELYRAVVVEAFTDHCKVYFVDYGNLVYLPYSQMYKIPPKFVTLKVMCHRFTLGKITDVYSEIQKHHFKSLVENHRVLQMTVTATDNHCRQYCELHLNYKSIKDILREI